MIFFFQNKTRKNDINSQNQLSNFDGNSIVEGDSLNYNILNNSENKILNFNTN